MLQLIGFFIYITSDIFVVVSNTDLDLYRAVTDLLFISLYCTLCGRIKGTKCTLFSIKCKGAIWYEKNTTMKLICYSQRIPEGDNRIFAYQHYAR